MAGDNFVNSEQLLREADPEALASPPQHPPLKPAQHQTSGQGWGAGQAQVQEQEQGKGGTLATATGVEEGYDDENPDTSQAVMQTVI